jgi:pimeloyl-ACP methyl ester carboxylesterase
MHNVAYPAGMAANSKTEGVAKTLSHVQAQAAACPNQKFVLVGYSQGADVMHNAAAKLPEALHPRVIAVVMFGDPGNMGPTAKSPLGGTVPVFPKVLANRLMENCAKGDPVCGGGSNILAHLTYGTGAYMGESAKFIQKQFQSGGTSGPNASALARGEPKGTA